MFQLLNVFDKIFRRGPSYSLIIVPNDGTEVHMGKAIHGFIKECKAGEKVVRYRLSLRTNNSNRTVKELNDRFTRQSAINTVLEALKKQ